MLRATTACTFSTSQRQKVFRTRQFFTLLTSKCASRHKGMLFFEIATSKSGPKLVCFVHFDFEMCYGPQRRALFRHRNYKAEVFYGNVLRATTACNFSSPIWPWLRTRRFSEPTFRPSGATNHCKNTVFRDFLTFSRTWIFLLGLSLSSSLLFSDSSHLCFLSVHIVGSLTSKLPLNSSFIMYLTDIYEAGILNSSQVKDFQSEACVHTPLIIIDLNLPIRKIKTTDPNTKTICTTNTNVLLPLLYPCPCHILGVQLFGVQLQL